MSDIVREIETETEANVNTGVLSPPADWPDRSMTMMWQEGLPRLCSMGGVKAMD